MESSDQNSIIELRDIEVKFKSRNSVIFKPSYVQAVQAVNLEVRPGENLGIVGEPGCGKSTTSNVMCGIQTPTAGQVFFRGQEVSKRSASDRRTIGRVVSVIFQDPSTALNARMTVHDQLIDPLEMHKVGTKAEREARVEELISRVGLPTSALEAMPGQLS